MSTPYESALPGRPLLSFETGEPQDVSAFFGMLAEKVEPDFDVEYFAESREINIADLQEGDVLHVVVEFPKNEKEGTMLRQEIEITHTLGELCVHFVSPLSVDGDIAPESDSRPTGFVLVNPHNGINREGTLRTSQPGVKVDYFIGGEAHFSEGGEELVYPDWAFGPVIEATFLPGDSTDLAA